MPYEAIAAAWRRLEGGIHPRGVASGRGVGWSAAEQERPPARHSLQLAFGHAPALTERVGRLFQPGLERMCGMGSLTIDVAVVHTCSVDCATKRSSVGKHVGHGARAAQLASLMGIARCALLLRRRAIDGHRSGRQRTDWASLDHVCAWSCDGAVAQHVR
eukprot:6560428-Prymnesium_polylepis.3